MGQFLDRTLKRLAGYNQRAEKRASQSPKKKSRAEAELFLARIMQQSGVPLWKNVQLFKREYGKIAKAVLLDNFGPGFRRRMSERHHGLDSPVFTRVLREIEEAQRH